MRIKVWPLLLLLTSLSTCIGSSRLACAAFSPFKLHVHRDIEDRRVRKQQKPLLASYSRHNEEIGIQEQRRDQFDSKTASPLFSSKSGVKDKNNDNRTSLLLAAATFVSTVTIIGNVLPLPARASFEISPGSAVIETSSELTPQKLIKSTTATAFKIGKTTFQNRKELIKSIQRLQSSIQRETSNTEIWKELYSIVNEYYGDNIESQIIIRPPTDWKRTYQDLVQEGKINFIINGEIVQVSLERTSPILDSKSGTTTSSNDIIPDDEWIVRIQGYRGVDPTLIGRAMKQGIDVDSFSPQWYLNFIEYWNRPYPESYLSKVLIPKEGEEIFHVTTYGDIIVFEGTLAIAFIYAWSYAYYLSQIEEQDKMMKSKQAKKKESSTVVKKKKDVKTEAKDATKQNTKKPAKPPTTESSTYIPLKGKGKNETLWITPTPPADNSVTAVAASVVEEPETAVALEPAIGKERDNKGQAIVATTVTKSKPQKRGGVFAFVQALYLPWLGMLVPSLTAETRDIKTNNDDEETDSVFAFVQALYFPWVGILQGK